MFPKLFEERGISLERLHTLCLVAEKGGITLAAGGDSTTQSLYSRQIKELEEFFGIKLILRSGRGIALTDQGRELAELAREHLRALNDYKLRCKNAPIKVSIASGDSLMHWLILPRLGKIQKRLQGVSFKFLNLKSAEIEKRITDGTLDFGLVRKREFGGQIKTAPIGTLKYSMFVSGLANHELNLKQVLAEFPVAILEGEGAFWREMMKSIQKGGMPLNVQIECSSFPLLAKVLATQKAAAILPSIARDNFDSKLVKEVRIPHLSEFDRKTVLIWSDRLGRIRPIIEKSSKVLKEELQFREAP